ncbi:MAG: efflux RND transporter periplasmic adaptor subunit [Desulfobacteraceae bacterium]|nr:efflux RND transporter periplasmic adaptor subunit [Desulfobacteraceae bacterium]MBU4001682.1 efflux RND transporter periplasmic adaptor subunit [Pseudomonadota bacterium]MBU4053906.1 efflux RND transporter periplasmic adaptor subunit [Pseudomonadota bacterium]
MRKRTLLKGLFLVILITPGCKTQVEPTKEIRIPVEISTVSLGEIKKSLDSSGDIKAELEVRVFSKIPERIEIYYVDEGDTIHRGEPIARVLAETIQHGVEQAEAGLAALQTRQVNLKSDFNRTRNLFKVNAVSKQQYDAVESQLESLTAQVEQAKAILATALSQHKDATITAPISGIIGKRFLETGDMAMPSLPVATVVQMDHVKIQFEATETDLGMLSLGQPSEVMVRSYPDRIFSGNVSKISPVLDPLTRMAMIEVLIPNSDHILKPGMFAKIRVTTGLLKDLIVIPRHVVLEHTTLKRENGQDQVLKDYYAFVVNASSKAEQRKLEVVYADHKSIAVRSGLSAGENLVVSGQKNLRDGVAVMLAGTGEK